jgi:hypothetical protein
VNISLSLRVMIEGPFHLDYQTYSDGHCALISIDRKGSELEHQ